MVGAGRRIPAARSGGAKCAGAGGEAGGVSAGPNAANSVLPGRIDGIRLLAAPPAVTQETPASLAAAATAAGRRGGEHRGRCILCISSLVAHLMKPVRAVVQSWVIFDFSFVNQFGLKLL